MVVLLRDGHVDLDSGNGIRNGKVIDVSPLLRKVMKALVSADGAVVSFEELGRSVWEQPHVERDTVQQAIGRLRKLVDDPASHHHVITVDGGYMWQKADVPCSPMPWVPRPALEARVRKLVKQSGSPAVLVGPYGSGRSSLARAVIRSIGERFHVASLDCQEVGQTDVARMSQVVDLLRRTLSEALPELGDVPCEDAHDLGRAIRDALKNAPRPVILCITNAERLRNPDCGVQVFGVLRSFSVSNPNLRLVLTVGEHPSNLVTDLKLSAFALTAPIFVGGMTPAEAHALALSEGVQVGLDDITRLTNDVGSYPLDLTCVLQRAAIDGWEVALQHLDGHEGLLSHRWHALHALMDCADVRAALQAAAEGRELHGPAYRRLLVAGVVVKNQNQPPRIATPWLERALVDIL